MSKKASHSRWVGDDRVGHVLADESAAPGALASRQDHLLAVLVPVALVAVAVVARTSGLDDFLTDHFFDFSSRSFPLRSDRELELVGHTLARTSATIVWICTLAGALTSLAVPELRPYRTVLFLTTLAMALGPVVVVLLKDATTFACPWNLRRYGGLAADPIGWFSAPAAAGRCFPSGHSAGGFSFVAFYFAALYLRRRRLAHWLLALTVALGSAFSIVRLVQGAHFLSHAIWSAAIDWLLAALVFMPSMLAGGLPKQSFAVAVSRPDADRDGDAR